MKLSSSVSRETLDLRAANSRALDSVCDALLNRRMGFKMLVCIGYADMLENVARESMSSDELLDSLLCAMSDTTKADLLEYVLRCKDITHVEADEYDLEWIDT